jgi:nucleoside 2-deoxyribosyltransferase
MNPMGQPMDRQQIYISGALFSAPDLAAARRLYESLADVCQECGFSAYLPHRETDPLRHKDATPRDVFARDFDMLSSSDRIVAVITHPSSGMGAELGIAFVTKKPVVALYDANHSVSRFLLGMLEAHRAAPIPFRDEKHATEVLRDALRR